MFVAGTSGRDFGGIVVTSTDIRVGNVEVHLNLTSETELVCHVHHSGEKIPNVVESISNSATTSVQGEEVVVTKTKITSSNGDEASSDGSDLSNECLNTCVREREGLTCTVGFLRWSVDATNEVSNLIHEFLIYLL